MVEQRVDNAQVTGSSPVTTTNCFVPYRIQLMNKNSKQVRRIASKSAKKNEKVIEYTRATKKSGNHGSEYELVVHKLKIGHAPARSGRRTKVYPKINER